MKIIYAFITLHERYIIDEYLYRATFIKKIDEILSFIQKNLNLNSVGKKFGFIPSTQDRMMQIQNLPEKREEI